MQTPVTTSNNYIYLDTPPQQDVLHFGMESISLS